LAIELPREDLRIWIHYIGCVTYSEFERFEFLELSFRELEETCQTMYKSVNSKGISCLKLTRRVIHFGASGIDVAVKSSAFKHDEGGAGINDA
jgi:hypothetical protein